LSSVDGDLCLAHAQGPSVFDRGSEVEYLHLSSKWKAQWCIGGGDKSLRGDGNATIAPFSATEKGPYVSVISLVDADGVEVVNYFGF